MSVLKNVLLFVLAHYILQMYIGAFITVKFGFKMCKSRLIRRIWFEFDFILACITTKP